MANLDEAADIAAALARRFEGLRLEAYYCPAGVLTIGYGATGAGIYPGMKVTREWAEARLRSDVSKYMKATLLYCPVLLKKPAGAIAGVSDFCLNLGADRLKNSTLRRKINEGLMDDAKVELGKWVWGGGRRLPGLVLRRQAEAQLLEA
jgi:lysozyme